MKYLICVFYKQQPERPSAETVPYIGKQADNTTHI